MPPTYHSLPHEPFYRRLDGPVTERFDCGDAEQNEFLLNHAWTHQQAGFSSTHLVYVGGILAGYVTLVTGEIELDLPERPDGAPFSRLGALKLAQMGVDLRFKGYKLGRTLVDFAILRARKLSEEIGCRYVILDAKPGIEGFYEKIGFVPNELAQKQRTNRAKKSGKVVAVSMRFDLRSPEDADPPPEQVASTRPGLLNAVAGLTGFVVGLLGGKRR